MKKQYMTPRVLVQHICLEHNVLAGSMVTGKEVFDEAADNGSEGLSRRRRKWDDEDDDDFGDEQNVW
mgnify:CR=1 FL=1